MLSTSRPSTRRILPFLRVQGFFPQVDFHLLHVQCIEILPVFGNKVGHFPYVYRTKLSCPTLATSRPFTIYKSTVWTQYYFNGIRKSATTLHSGSCQSLLMRRLMAGRTARFARVHRLYCCYVEYGLYDLFLSGDLYCVERTLLFSVR